ncbi:MAG TPA: patatin-like phospholipase family protein [Candidatus Methylomirabilis sp.]|nr:patatin-like phospholipase family protein [Candidatus Methylomirabilis sp.]
MSEIQAPSADAAHTANTAAPLHFDAVLADERNAGWPEEGKAVGLAFSGGGIRSATFNLGVIQALAERKLLQKFDYLSTISGGGYIGGWLSLFIKRYGEGHVAQAEIELGKREHNLEHPAIRFLRSFSNYLTPRVGLSKDTLVALATYLRNLLLNFVILIALIGGVLILPRIAAQLGKYVVNWKGFATWYYPLMVVALIPPTFAVALGLFYRPVGREIRRPWFMRSRALIALVDVPVVTAGSLAACHYIQSAGHEPLETQFWATVGLYVLLWVVGVILAIAHRSEETHTFTRFGTTPDKAKWQAAFLAFAVLAGAAGAAFMMGIGKAILALPEEHRFWAAVTFGPPTVIGAVLLMVTAHVGLMGRKFAESDRELWSVYGARLLALAVAWAGIFAIALYGTALLKWTTEWIVAMGGFAWVASTLFGVLAAKSTSTGKADSKRWVEVLTRLAPYVFVLGLLLALSWGLQKGLNWGQDVRTDKPAAIASADKPHSPSPGIYLRADPSAGAPLVTVRGIDTPSLWKEFLDIAGNEYERIQEWFTPPWALAAMAGAAFLAALLVSWRVNINLFSLHHFYRNRLTRCYLGATNRERRPHPLTGFDPDDDVPLRELANQRPLHIVGTAINLNRGRQLAWQNRRAASFAFTPRHAGYEPASRYVSGGFRPVAEYGMDADKLPIPLGTVVAISGAAASPNMGFHTSPAVAFLLTVFNVRLGHWCGDPAHKKAWRYRDPLMSLRYWIAELTGSADLDYPFVSLSDGGHFENLGVYELVRRRCSVILASDAGADPKYAFDDLAEAMRKCYTDFGVEIRFKTSIDDIRPKREKDVPEKEWLSARHYAIADITYPDSVKNGTLIYWKTSLTADLPPDIMNYRRTHKDFPHETTVDQFFDESQFESYRHLGYQVAIRSLDAMRAKNELPAALYDSV